MVEPGGARVIPPAGQQQGGRQEPPKKANQQDGGNRSPMWCKNCQTRDHFTQVCPQRASDKRGDTAAARAYHAKNGTSCSICGSKNHFDRAHREGMQDYGQTRSEQGAGSIKSGGRQTGADGAAGQGKQTGGQQQNGQQQNGQQQPPTTGRGPKQKCKWGLNCRSMLTTGK